MFNHSARIELDYSDKAAGFIKEEKKKAKDMDLANTIEEEAGEDLCRIINNARDEISKCDNNNKASSKALGFL